MKRVKNTTAAELILTSQTASRNNSLKMNPYCLVGIAIDLWAAHEPFCVNMCIKDNDKIHDIQTTFRPRPLSIEIETPTSRKYFADPRMVGYRNDWWICRHDAKAAVRRFRVQHHPDHIGMLPHDLG
jgi:hypothetical protein